jgi:hypothetical protein
VSRNERIYALLVEANPVSDPDALPEKLVDAVPRFTVVDPRRAPMQTEETIQLQPDKPPSRRVLIRGLAVAAVVIAALAAGVLLLNADDDPDVADGREQDAVARTEAFLAAINAGDIEAVESLTTSPGEAIPEDDQRMWEFNIVVSAQYPQQVRGCEATDANKEFVYVDCSVASSDPVWVATGVSEYTVPWWVYDEGRMVWRGFEGVSFTQGTQAYAEYLRLRHPDEYAEVCAPVAYLGSLVNSKGGIAFTKGCAELIVPLAADIADWVEAGKPGS